MKRAKKTVKKTLTDKFQKFEDELMKLNQRMDVAAECIEKIYEQKKLSLLAEAKKLIETMGLKGKIRPIAYSEGRVAVYFEIMGNGREYLEDLCVYKKLESLFNSIGYVELSKLEERAEEIKETIEKNKAKQKELAKKAKKNSTKNANEIARLLSNDDSVRKQVFKILAK